MKKFRNIALIILASIFVVAFLIIRVGMIDSNSEKSSTSKSEYVQNISNYDVHLLEKFLVFEAASAPNDDLTEMLYIGCVALNRIESGKNTSLEEFIQKTYSAFDGGFEKMMALDELCYNDPRFVQARTAVQKLIVENHRPIDCDIIYYQNKEFSKQPKDITGQPAVETENFYFYK